MPKETFFNLPDSKRNEVFDSAVKEFSVHMFSEASINRIVKTAEIPRGSFYQYFDGKEDLFSYVIARIFTEIEEILQTRHKELSDADALSLFMEKVYATVELNKKRPEYARITFLQSRDETPFVKQFFKLSDAQRLDVLKLFDRDKRSGIIKEDVDSSLVIDMVYTLSIALFFDVGMDGEAYIKKMEEAIKIIREGIRRDSI